MIYLFGIFLFILGTTIGSFLNVVIYRYNTGMGVNGRSQCFSCGKTLQWYELIPLFSFIFLRGRCGQCQSKISWQYPLVELTTGLVFLLFFLKIVGTQIVTPALIGLLLYSLVIASIFIVIFVYDLKHKIIPDGLVIALSVFALISLFVTPEFTFQRPSILAILAGPILAAPFALLWLMSRGRWMGLGDAKLVLPMGWFLGLTYGFSAIIIAFWIGAIIGVGLILLSGKLGAITMKSEIPFAPFLIIGFLLVYFLGLNVFNLSTFWGIYYL
ncbi:prepilin peptidase [Candidatus Parcubacteria bacterium]|nr:prepilin peptidase [Candidatus Parcubacteria bacterium]